LPPFCPEPSVFSTAFKILKNDHISDYILPVVLYGCETWSLTLREAYRLKVFEKNVLRRIFSPKRGKLARGWKSPHDEELRDLYSSASIIRIIKSRRIKWAGHVVRKG
jgi:hypothetical protein